MCTCGATNEEMCLDGHDEQCTRCCGCKLVPLELSINVVNYLQSLVMLDYIKNAPKSMDQDKNLKEIFKTLSEAVTNPL
jgi:hypothetical protein